MPDFDTTVAALRHWATQRSNQAHAAVELLAWHEHWLRRRDFLTAAVVKRGAVTVINWDMAAEFMASNPRGSMSELAVLDLAIAIGSDRYKLSGMGHAHAAAIVRAFAWALGYEAKLARKEQQ